MIKSEIRDRSLGAETPYFQCGEEAPILFLATICQNMGMQSLGTRSTRNAVYQTARFKLALNDVQAERLRETTCQYAVAFNKVCRIGWQLRRTNGVELHHATYRDLRKELALPAQLVVSARMKAVEALTSAKALRKSGRTVSRPCSRHPGIRFDARSFRVDWEKRLVLLSIVDGRMKVPFHVDRHSAQFVGLPARTAEVIRGRKGWVLHVVVEREVEEHKPTAKVVGVDRGIHRPAVTSDGKFLGDPRWKSLEEHYRALRSRLQAKGTRSAKRHLTRLNDRLARFRRDCDHVLSKRLVQSVEPGDTLVFEDLTNIRSRARSRGKASRRRLHAWSCARLGALVEYKAALRGVRVAYIDPRDTSRRCPACGLIEKGNREDQAHFSCLRCRFSRNSDLVAAWNVRDRHRGLWSPVSTVPGRVNGPNAGVHVVRSCKPRTSVRGS